MNIVDLQHKNWNLDWLVFIDEHFGCWNSRLEGAQGYHMTRVSSHGHVIRICWKLLARRTLD
jgi:hypothetical protein